MSRSTNRIRDDIEFMKRSSDPLMGIELQCLANELAAAVGAEHAATIAELRAEVSAIRMEAETQLNVTNILIEALNKKEEYIAKIQAENAAPKPSPPKRGIPQPIEWPEESLRQEASDARIAELEAEVADLKARPAMAWRRREDARWTYEQWMLCKTVIDGIDVIAVGWGVMQDMVSLEGYHRHVKWADITHVIPWSDLMPPGGEEAA